MAITVKFRRGSTSQSNSFLGQEGELYIDKDKDTVVVHDGVTVGGKPLATESFVIDGLNTKQKTLTSGVDIKTINGLSLLGSDDFSLVEKINIPAGSVGSATEIPVITYNTQGQITSVTTSALDLSTKVDKINIASGSVGSGTKIPVISYNSQGQITIVSEASIDIGDIETRIGGTIATQGYVQTEIANLVDSSPSTLNTLNELAAALNDDPSFATTISNQIGLKWTQDNTKISNWDTAYSWGNHANYGYASAVQVSSQLSQKADLSGATFTGTVDVRAPLNITSSLGTLTFASDTSNRIIMQYQNGSTTNWWQSLQASGDLQLYSPNNKKFVIYGSTNTYVGINTTNPQTTLEVNGTVTATTYALSTNWKVKESGGVLFFEHNGVNKMKLDASGNLTVTGDITAFGTV